MSCNLRREKFEIRTTFKAASQFKQMACSKNKQSRKFLYIRYALFVPVLDIGL
jgi:hypothetical protein